MQAESDTEEAPESIDHQDLLISVSNFSFDILLQKAAMSFFIIDKQCRGHHSRPFNIHFRTEIIGICFIKPHNRRSELSFISEPADLIRK
jgi:hypothetical protein